MSVGDLVVHRALFGVQDYYGVGLVVDINSWADSGAPDRNFGVDVHVLWPSGQTAVHEEVELEIFNESR